jgi:hypothetical protein
MSLAHVHLALTHVPVVGLVFGLAILAYAFFRDSLELKKASLLIFVLMGVAAVVVFSTGDPAEGAIRRLPGFSRTILRRHEEAALLALVASAALGLTSLAGLILFRQAKPIPRWFTIGSLLIALVASGTMAWTASLGGQVRHTEIRDSAIDPPAAGDVQGQVPRSSGRDDPEGDEHGPR